MKYRFINPKLVRQNFTSQKKPFVEYYAMEKKLQEDTDRLQLARYCQRHFRQKVPIPQTFIDASYDDLVKFLQREGRNVEDIFLEIFLEETPDLLDSK